MIPDLKPVGEPDAGKLARPVRRGASEFVKVYFKNIEEILLKYISESDIVGGCVAWLTSAPIFEALSKKLATAIVVQNEDFLRPDIGADDRWKENLHRLYTSLPGGLSRYDAILEKMDTRLYLMSSCGSPDIDAINSPPGISGSRSGTVTENPDLVSRPLTAGCGQRIRAMIHHETFLILKQHA